MRKPSLPDRIAWNATAWTLILLVAYLRRTPIGEGST